MKWKPLERARLRPVTAADIANAVRAMPGTPRDQIVAALEAEAASEYWLNDIYQVQVKRDAAMAHINIRRRDGRPILRDWRHFQQIKNEIVGAECEAIELYPAESRKVDGSNKYHLWASTDPAFRFPLGFTARAVSDIDGATPGTRQRKGA